MGAIDDSKSIKPSDEAEKVIIVVVFQKSPKKPKKKNKISKKMEEIQIFNSFR